MPPSASPPLLETEREHRFDPKGPPFGVGTAKVLLKLAEALLADESAGELTPAPETTCQRGVAWLEHSLCRASSTLRRGFPLLVFALEWLPLFVMGRFSRASRLSLADRVAYLEALEESRHGWLCMLLVAVKVPMSIAIFEEGDELRSTGFDRASLSARRELRRLPVAAEGTR